MAADRDIGTSHRFDLTGRLKQQKRYYMAKSPEDGMASLIRNLEEKTGKSIDAWDFNAMVTHRVRAADVSEVDSQLIAWLRQAYDKA
jgi:hypothetical protein